MVVARKRKSLFGIPSMMMNFAGEAQAPASRGAIGARQHRAKGLPLPGTDAPQRPRGGLGGPPKRNWGRTAALAMSALSELDPANRGSTMFMRDRFAQSDARRAAAAEEQRRQAMMQKYTDSLSPEMAQLAQLAPDKFLESRVEQAFAGPAQKRTFEGADGFHYYEDGSRVLPGVTVEPKSDWQRTTVNVDGKNTIIEYDRNASDINASIRVIGDEPAKQPLVKNYVNTSPEAEASDLLDPPQVKGKDPAIVFAKDGSIKLTGNAQQGAFTKATLRYNEVNAKQNLVRDEISRSLNLFTTFDEVGNRVVREGQTAVGPASATRHIPIFGDSTEAGTMEGFLNTIRANVGFDELQAMRDASPTGGALGQVSEREIAFLQALLGDLEQQRDPEIFMQNLVRLDEYLAGRQERYLTAFQMDYPDAFGAIDQRKQAEQSIEDLLKIY